MGKMMKYAANTLFTKTASEDSDGEFWRAFVSTAVAPIAVNLPSMAIGKGILRGTGNAIDKSVDKVYEDGLVEALINESRKSKYMPNADALKGEGTPYRRSGRRPTSVPAEEAKHRLGGLQGFLADKIHDSFNQLISSTPETPSRGLKQQAMYTHAPFADYTNELIGGIHVPEQYHKLFSSVMSGNATAEQLSDAKRILPIYAHEMGHAANTGSIKNKLLRELYSSAQALSALGTSGALTAASLVPFFADEENIDSYLDASSLVGAGSFLLRLYEEASASIRGKRLLSELNQKLGGRAVRWGDVKSLPLAFGSYLAQLGGVAAVPQAIKYVYHALEDD